MPRIGCQHQAIRQIAYDEFECGDCRMLFLGMDGRHPNARVIIDAIRTIGGSPPSGMPQAPYTSPTPNIPLDFQAVPEDLAVIKTKMDDLEKTLSVFVEILKNALQS